VTQKNTKKEGGGWDERKEQGKEKIDHAEKGKIEKTLQALAMMIVASRIQQRSISIMGLCQTHLLSSARLTNFQPRWVTSSQLSQTTTSQ
jgi:hypothetical protein